MNISSVGSTPVPVTAPPPPVSGNVQQAGNGRAPAAPSAPEGATAKKTENGSEPQKATREKLNEAVEKANSFLRPINSSIEFTAHEDSGQMVVRVVDQQTKEVIRQIPNEEMVQISLALDKLQGLLIHQKV